MKECRRAACLHAGRLASVLACRLAACSTPANTLEYMQISLHRWIAERFWLRCFHIDVNEQQTSKSKASRKNESFFDAREFILEYPKYNNLEYDGMHKHAEKVQRDLRADEELDHARLEAEGKGPKKIADAATLEKQREETRWLAPTADNDSEGTLSFVFVLQDSRCCTQNPTYESMSKYTQACVSTRM